MRNDLTNRAIRGYIGYKAGPGIAAVLLFFAIIVGGIAIFGAVSLATLLQTILGGN